jgi:hypothetical protein
MVGVDTFGNDGIGVGVGVGAGVEPGAANETSFEYVLSRPVVLEAVTAKKYVLPASKSETDAAAVFPTQNVRM